MAGAALRGLLEFLLPRACAGCRVPLEPRAEDSKDLRAVDRVLCGACSRTLEFLDRAGCRLCQLPSQRLTIDGRCHRCALEDSPLDACIAAVAFEGSAESWIRDFKYPRKGIAGLLPGPESVMIALVRDAARMLDHSRADLVVPVPLHPARLRARGFNPATTLARAISERTNCRLATGLLVRTRDTPTQTHLGRRRRRDNVRDAFGCTAPPAQTIWLVDDVVTTGSTLEEAARCLRRAGAKKILGLCVARTR
ncbi:MAG: ComF family protein [Deltaproteobacteria bacterium]|nr:ComF family protein [Deltaproteobacteria bacterium]